MKQTSKISRYLMLPLALAALLLAPAISQATVYYYTSTTGGTTTTDGAGTWTGGNSPGAGSASWRAGNTGTAGTWINNNDAVFGATNNGAAGAITLASTP